jgi:hypothetical protein
MIVFVEDTSLDIFKLKFYSQARKGQVTKAVYQTVFVTMEAVAGHSIPHVLLSGFALYGPHVNKSSSILN